MAHELSPYDPRELLGAHALGALDDDEAARVEALVLDDHDARAELHALQLGASWLSSAGPQPEARVWDAIRDEIDATAPVVPIAEARRARPRRRAWMVAAAAVVAALALGAGVATLVDGGGAPPSVESAARAAAADPSSRSLSLDSAAGEPRVETVVTKTGTAYVTDDSLPTLPRDETYQLWVITPDGPRSAGVLGRDPGVHRFDVPDDARRLAVTDEPSGGSDAPTGIVLATADLA